MEPTGALLVSDIHLPVGRSEYRDALLALLRGPARQVQRLYLLGDIFEVWLGDDVSLPDHAEVFEALAELTRSGVEIAFQHGNRDFLLGSEALRRGGMQLLPDPTRVTLPDGTALLSHGDIWCTQDVSYQRWRRFAHNPWAQRLFLALPARLRRRIAARIRAASANKGRRDPDRMLDVVGDSIEHALRASGEPRIIHGHTHRPGHYRHGAGERIVLPDWRPGSYGYLVVNADGPHWRNMASANAA